MITTINNDWITLSEQRNGVTVQRKFAGLDTRINLENEVEYCSVKYWERELYPNNEVIKTEFKSYKLEDLAYTEIVVDGITYSMAPLAVLSGFVANLGDPYIIGPARQTLTNCEVLPLSVPDGYPLHLDTRTKTQT
jgi:hypothetical protein